MRCARSCWPLWRGQQSLSATADPFSAYLPCCVLTKKMASLPAPLGPGSLLLRRLPVVVLVLAQVLRKETGRRQAGSVAATLAVLFLTHQSHRAAAAAAHRGQPGATGARSGAGRHRRRDRKSVV